MGEDEKKVRNINDYYEYPKQERGKIGLADTIQAAVNTITANVTQKKLVNNTAERYSISGDDIEEFLYANYKDEKSKEYLVNGAILTCTNCTKENVEIKDGDKIYECHAKENTDMDTTSISDWDIDKVAGKLIVTENPASEVTGLHNATVVDSERENNIPYFGNCKRNPDSEQELNEFRKIHGEGRGVIKIEEGSCKYLMKLEEKWENYEIGQEFVSYTDDKKGKNSGITMTSILFCKHGGFIYPVTSGQIIAQYELKELLISKNYIALSHTVYESAKALKKGTQKKIQDLCYINGIVYFDEDGYQRVRDTGLDSDPYLVALAEYYQKSAIDESMGNSQGYGAIFKVTFSSGKEIFVTMGDLKDPVDTQESLGLDNNNLYGGTGNGANTLEFICNSDNKNSDFYSDNMTRSHGTDVNLGSAFTVTGNAEITSIELLIGTEIEWERYFDQSEEAID